MPRLLIHVEGQTEESFVNEVLRDYLFGIGYESISARIVGNARLRQQRGGIRPWPVVRKDIINHLKQDAGCLATTMIDFYGLPRDGDRAWPGRAEAAQAETHLKGSIVESALGDDFANESGGKIAEGRFIPFVVMHEYEALLFSDCAAFAQGIGRMDLEPKFSQIRDSFANPEQINDSFETCPSRRVKHLVPGYEKPLFGTLAALEIGVNRIRAACPHFADWLQRLESAVHL